jgi:uncharacterized protein (TIGR02246 family)
MARLAVRFALFSTLLALAAAARAQQPTLSPPPKAAAAQPAAAPAIPASADRPAEPKPSPEEQAIRANIEAFRKAFDAGNAHELAEIFTLHGELVDNEGHVIQGRSAIEKQYTSFFARRKGAKIEINVDALEFVGSKMAFEEGRTTVRFADGQTDDEVYTVIHVKGRDGWRMALARDRAADRVDAEGELERLAWMIGDWIDESPSALVETSYRWSENRRAILGDYQLRVAGKVVLTGTQRIAWDPLAKAMRSWVFDSQGGFRDGLWARDGERWVINLHGATHDGQPSSVTNVLTVVSPDRCTWQSRDRVVSGKLLPDSEPTVVVRRPPARTPVASKP